MPQPYSYDLRQKVIQAIQLDGLKIIEASIWFDRASQHDRAMALSDKPKQGTF